MSEERILNTINGPDDLKALNYAEIEELGKEIRACLIDKVSMNGGHLASNLGVVELTMAVHRVFCSPKDQIIFDVGHQCYVHKMLTGRFTDFERLRKSGGLSGFPNPDESEHDVLKTGHSSTAISSAAGLLKAFQLQGENDRFVVAIVGDGAMTGGLSYEGLNNGGHMKGNLIVILNDNDMSISPNVGSFAAYLSRIRSKKSYFRFKDFLIRITTRTPLIGKWIYRFFQSVKNALKSVFYQGNIFEYMGFAYLGPIDGHNQRVLERVLERAKSLHKPCVVHIKTTKGKGYSYAENQPSDYHGLSSFDVRTGQQKSADRPDFSTVFGQTLCEFAEKDKRICAITAAMGTGCGLSLFAKKYPDRFFDVGIAEQHAVTFAGGLARNGMKPVFAVYSSFLQRGFDQVIHDVSLQRLSITLCIDRAGLVGEDGETHQGLFDIPMLIPVPDIQIFSPSGYGDLRAALSRSFRDNTGIIAIRYPRGCEYETLLPFKHPETDAEFLGKNKDLCIVSYGRQVIPCLIGLQTAGRPASFLKLNRIYPISDEVIRELLEFRNILLFEECYEIGGIGEYLGNILSNYHFAGKYQNHGIKNSFLPSGKVDDLLKQCGLDGASVARTIHHIEE